MVELCVFGGVFGGSVFVTPGEGGGGGGGGGNCIPGLGLRFHF